MKRSHFSKVGILAILVLLSISGCKFRMNFTGLPPGQVDDLHTINIETFPNEAPLIVPTLSQTFTIELQDYFLSRSRLTLTSDPADVLISGVISGYRVTPVAIAGNETAEQNRLTITVKVKYDNNVNEKDSWEQSFSSFQDFNATNNLASVEGQLIDLIVDQLAQDIFTRSLGKW